MLRNSGAGLRTCAAVMSRQRSAVSSQALWKPRSASMGRCASSWTTILGSTTQSSSLRECPRFDRSSASMLHTSSLLRDDVIEVAGPAFADSISEGDIRWLKQKGDHVKEDELVAEIETDKTSVEVPAPQAGVIEELLVADGDKVTAKQKLYKLRPGAGGGASASKEAPKKEEPKKEAPKKEEPKKGDTKRGEEHKEEPQKEEAKKATGAAPPPVPRAETLSGPIPATAPPPSKLPVGPKSSKPVTDIKVSVPKGIPAEQAITGTRSETRVKMNRMRLRIAQRLKDAQNTYAMLTTFNEIDMSNLVDMRTKYQKDFTKKHNIKLGFMSPFIKAAAYALQDQPIVNAVIDEGEIVYRHFVDLSIAVATPKGLVVPVLRNIEAMNLADIEQTLNDVGEKARSGKLAIEDMEGGTFTISNGGVFGSLYGTPIINPPQSAILGMHAIVDRPVAVNGKVEIRPIMTVALTYDHRLIDGREAVTFLKKIKTSIEDPRTMLLAL